MKTTRLTEATTSDAAPPDVLACAGKDGAYGVKLIPWDAHIRLQPSPPGMDAAPRLKGVMTTSECLVPIFDLMEETGPAVRHAQANTFLLVISMSKNASGPMAMGLLVNTVQGKFEFPAGLILNPSRGN